MYTGTGVAYVIVLQKEPRSCTSLPIGMQHVHVVYAYTMYVRFIHCICISSLDYRYYRQVTCLIISMPRHTGYILISSNPTRIVVMFHLGGSFFATESQIYLFLQIQHPLTPHMPKGNF